MIFPSQSINNKISTEIANHRIDSETHKSRHPKKTHKTFDYRMFALKLSHISVSLLHSSFLRFSSISTIPSKKLYENSLVLVKLKNYYHSQQKTVEIGFNIQKEEKKESKGTKKIHWKNLFVYFAYKQMSRKK
jgi:hypothetical protein